LDFIDLGLIPALETHIRKKLDPLLRDALFDAQKLYKKSAGQDADPRELFRLAFWVLAGKILHDRNQTGFRELDDESSPDEILDRVAHHYKERAPRISDEEALACVRDRLWGNIDFRNLSGDVLAHVYENTLVTAELRKEAGIHATPRTVAEYIVHHLPLDEFPLSERRVVEPCCGHATFLVAALKRLRELSPADWTDSQRHTYMKRRLWGFEMDSFALEVARLSLTLADLPNPNGWHLEPTDVFRSRKLAGALRRANAVVCNPPFEAFGYAERPKHPALSVHKPVAMLEVVLRDLHPKGVLGFVLPRTVLDGRGYREMRSALAGRFDHVEFVGLPDTAFEHSGQETVLLLASCPGGHPTVSVCHHKVKDGDWPAFRDLHKKSREDVEEKSVESASENLGVLELRETWEYLAKAPRLREVAEIHRGIEWSIPLRENRHKLVSDTPKAGFAKGVLHARKSQILFEPNTSYLRVNKYQRGNAVGLPWDKPKVLLNTAALSRGAWRLAATADGSGLVAYQNFHGIWPRGDWPPSVLAAILNGPVANAFVATREGKRDVKIRTLREIPLPDLLPEEKHRVRVLVSQYLECVGSLRSPPDHENASELLRGIDAALLRGYGLPPRLERQVLDFFRGERRPTPFDFGDYFPPDFESYVPLHLYLSDQYRRSNAASVRAAFERLPRHDSVRRVLEAAVEAFEE